MLLTPAQKELLNEIVKTIESKMDPEEMKTAKRECMERILKGVIKGNEDIILMLLKPGQAVYRRADVLGLTGAVANINGTLRIYMRPTKPEDEDCWVGSFTK